MENLRLRRFFASFIVSVLLPVAASGIEGENETQKIVVTATKANFPAEQLGASVEVITEEEIRRSGKKDVASLLSDVKGFTVARTGSRGGFVSLLARGGQSDHNLVMINGVQVNQAGGGFDLGSLSTENVKRIEIVKGAHSSLYGSDAAASVINIITKTGRGNFTLSADAAMGIRAEKNALIREYSAGASGSGENYGYFLSVGRISDEGILKPDNDYDNTGFTANFDMEPAENVRVSLFSVYRDSEFRFPTGGAGDRFTSVADPDQGTKEKSTVAGGDVTFFPRQWWENSVRVGYARVDRESYDGPLPVSPDGTPDFATEFTTLDEKFSLEYVSTFFAERGSVTSVTSAGVEFEKESFESGEIDRSRKNYAFYLQEHLGFNGRIFVTPGVRFDDNDSFGRQWSPSLFSSLKVDEAIRIRAGAGKGIKEPTFFENFSASFGTIPNPDLKPEESVNAEMGADWEFLEDRAELAVTFFRNRFKNLIAYSFSAFPNGTNYENISGVSSKGVEVGFSVATGPEWTIEAGYTYTDTEVTDTAADSAGFSEGKRLIRVPDHSFVVAANYSRDSLNANVSGNYIGARDDVNFSEFPGIRVENDSYFTVDIAVSYDLALENSVAERLRLFTRIENLFNKNYENVFGFSSPGFSWVSGVSAAVRPSS